MSGECGAAACAQARGDRRTILLVEDEILVRAVAADHLLDLNYNVLQAASADEAVRVLAIEPEVDLVFSDINMPGRLNGIDLATLVRRDYPHIKVLLSSALPPTSAELRDVPFLAKPYRLSELTDRLQRMLDD